ncbi:FAD-dependent monooxygenase [Rhizobium sp. TRM96647]|uniref:FAD-dependent monooxygenase n=1 Tax=unclassified Rhizobium TaxID=2613769 RepID=UPI0021E8E19B|nr:MULTISPECIES: FAD-dependent monooxygenase [unclassified Rhizobium]MCV3737608.1 FAD-dependent monooxygenase [Rhizobium sp. TRM96647]MCV3756302.1 FAD-dependent monooxygenase [Rhizobium sp. TRM96650]
MTVRTVAIVGAGIAGLTAALCLARKGISSHLIEQADRLEEVGAGLQLSPNATRVLSVLGLLPALERRWTEPERIVLASGRSLKPLAQVPAGADARRRWHDPYGVLHRATLQKVLFDAARDNPLVGMTLGVRMEGYDRAAEIADLIGVRPDLTIAADGVWSTMRAGVPGAANARFSGNIAWRFMIPFAKAPRFLDPRAVTAFVGPSSHLVAYPLTEANAFNIVAIHKGPAFISRGWETQAGEAGAAFQLDAFSGWNKDIAALLALAEKPLAWPLYECGDGRWFDGNDLVLIGDAAHATTPFAAQGAAMAIEDAAELAQAVADASDFRTALSDFETRRRQRVRRVRARADFNRFAYHARGPVALVRDVVLGLRSPERLAADLDWLYGYRPHI